VVARGEGAEGEEDRLEAAPQRGANRLAGSLRIRPLVRVRVRVRVRVSLP